MKSSETWFVLHRKNTESAASEQDVSRFQKKTLHAFPLYNFNKVCSPIRVVGPGVVLFSRVSVRFMFPNVLLNL